MKKKLFLWFAIFLFPMLLVCSEVEEKKDDVIYKIGPLVSSNPTAGTGAGAAAMAVYQVDGASSPSQAMVGGQYTDTKSYSIFAGNIMFFDSDRWQSKTFGGHIYNNASYEIPFYVPISPSIPDPNIAINATITVAGQQFLYRFKPSWYIGAQLFYLNQKFNPLNATGALFLKDRGIEDSQRFAYGGALSYDTRSKKEKFYPKDALWIDFNFNQFPKIKSKKHSYQKAILNCRLYKPGFREVDVVALQLFGQYSSKYTPDGALSPLGAKNILRGFPIGLHKARNMITTQVEYRYKIISTAFRATLFGGWANLSGGSYGDGEGDNRDIDNGNYYSGGAGVHYILDKKQQLDYRINLVYSSDKEVSFYAGINQAF